MAYRLDAGCVRVLQEKGVLLVGFADREFDTAQYVTLQRSLDPDAQDAALGLDLVHLEVDDQSRSSYGGLASIHLHRDRVVISLDDAGAARTGCPDGIDIRFQIASEHLDELREALESLFGGPPCLRDFTGPD